MNCGKDVTLFSKNEDMWACIQSSIPCLSYGAPKETVNMAKGIISELKSNPDAYDVAEVFGTLEKNGCLRYAKRSWVYADMTNTMLQNSKCISLENKVLAVLAKTRLASAEALVEKL